MRSIAYVNDEEVVYAVSCIPSVIISTLIVVYYSFFRLPAVYPIGSSFKPVLWDMLFYVIVPGLALAPLSFFVTFEILSVERLKTNRHINFKRLAGRVVIQLVAIGLLTSTYLLFVTILLPLTSVSVTLVTISLVWIFLFYATMKRFRKAILRFEKGEW